MNACPHRLRIGIGVLTVNFVAFATTCGRALVMAPLRKPGRHQSVYKYNFPVMSLSDGIGPEENRPFLPSQTGGLFQQKVVCDEGWCQRGGWSWDRLIRFALNGLEMREAGCEVIFVDVECSGKSGLKKRSNSEDTESLQCRTRLSLAQRSEETIQQRGY